MYLLNDEDWGNSLKVEEIEMKWSILEELINELAKFIHSDSLRLYIGKRETHYFAVILKGNHAILNVQIYAPFYGHYGRFFIDQIKTGSEKFDCLNDKNIEMEKLKEILNTLI